MQNSALKKKKDRKTDKDRHEQKYFFLLRLAINGKIAERATREQNLSICTIIAVMMDETKSLYKDQIKNKQLIVLYLPNEDLYKYIYAYMDVYIYIYKPLASH